jgi:hypothetical protein
MIEKMVLMMSVVFQHEPPASIVLPLESWLFWTQRSHRGRFQVHFLGGLYRKYDIVRAVRIQGAKSRYLVPSAANMPRIILDE